MPAAAGGRVDSASGEYGGCARAECPEGLETSGRRGSLGDDRHPGEGTDRQRRRRGANTDLQLRGGEAVAAVARGAQSLGRIRERMRINVDLGAELRDEQCQRQHSTDQPEAVSTQNQILESQPEYPPTGTDRQSALFRGLISSRFRAARIDLEPEDAPTLPLQTCGIRQFRRRHDIHVDPVHGAGALTVHDAG